MIQTSQLAQSLVSHRQTVVLPGIQLSYLEWGNAGEPVLLLHGLADCGAVWLKVVEELGDPYHCVAPDLRGHGDSEKPPTGYRCQDVMTDLDHLMTTLGWDAAHVVAHSWSAKVAAVWAQQAPQRIKSLTLIDPFFIQSMPNWVQVTFPLFYRVLPFLQLMGPFASYGQAEAKARQQKQYREWTDYQQVAFQSGLEQKPGGEWGSKFVIQARNEIFQDAMQVNGLAQPIEVPTLLVLPEAGLNRMEWQIQPFRSYIPHLEIAQVPSHHWCFLSQPMPVSERLGQFLGAVTESTCV